MAEDDLLQDAGFNVCAVGSGAEMLEVVAMMESDIAAHADIIVTDVAMPGASDLFVIEELRASGWPEPVIVISGCDPLLLIARLEALDDVELLSKPYAFAELEALVRQRAP